MYAQFIRTIMQTVHTAPHIFVQSAILVTGMPYIHGLSIGSRECVTFNMSSYVIWLTLIPACVSNCMPSKIGSEITYTFSSLNVTATFEYWEWMSNFIIWICSTRVNAKFSMFNLTNTFSCAAKQKGLTFHRKDTNKSPVQNQLWRHQLNVNRGVRRGVDVLFMDSLYLTSRPVVYENEIISHFWQTDIHELISMRIIVIDALLQRTR